MQLRALWQPGYRVSRKASGAVNLLRGFLFGEEIDLQVESIALLAEARLPVLAHENDRRGEGRLERQYQVQKNERIRVSVQPPTREVDDHPRKEKDSLNGQECPGSHPGSDSVGQA